MELPIRMKDRKLHAEPSKTKSNTLNDEPIRIMP
jgi:hypothetical protein